jgi:hypothetical protein
MAHFAELNENNEVVRIVVVANDIPVNGQTLLENDMHIDGEKWCENFFGGGVWKQTSYNSNFRKQYAGIGYTYDFEKDIFIAPRPFPSWSLDLDNEWQAPVPYPSITTYAEDDKYLIIWDEDNLRWLGYDDVRNEFLWNPQFESWSATGNVL